MLRNSTIPPINELVKCTYECILDAAPPYYDVLVRTFLGLKQPDRFRGRHCATMNSFVRLPLNFLFWAFLKSSLLHKTCKP